MPEPETASPAERPDTSPEMQGHQKMDVNARMLGVSASMTGPEAVNTQRQLIGKTVLDGVHQAQERIAASDCIRKVETALGAVTALPRNASTWRGYLQSLKTLLTKRNSADPGGGNGDPVQLVGHLANAREALGQLAADAQGETGVRRQVIQNVLDAYRTVSQTVGLVHSAIMVPGTQGSWKNEAVQKRGSHLLAIGAFGMFAGMGTLLGGLTLIAKEEDRNAVPAAIFLAAAGITALTQQGREIAFLTDPGSKWHDLGITGDGWADFTDRYYQTGTRNRAITEFVQNRPPSRIITPEQRQKQLEQQHKAILDLAPESVRPRLTAMLTTVRNGTAGGDFRELDGLLRQATSRESQERVVRFIRLGATLASLQALNQPQRMA